LVVVPGAFGSVLRHASTGRELWPGSFARLLVGRYRDLALEIDGDPPGPAGWVEVAGVFENGPGESYYGALLRTLERAGGYRRCTPGQPVDPAQRNYYVLLYDWRLDISVLAKELHGLISAIRSDYGDPTRKVDILAHSSGGLVARYYARCGTAALGAGSEPTLRPTFEGAASIRRLLLVGTPNLGSLQPVLAYARGEEIGLGHIPQEVVATFPGAPQLMPHPAVPWLADVRGRVVRRDPFDVETWRELRWCVFDPAVRERTIARHGGGARGRRYLDLLERTFAEHLARGRRFVTLLAEPAGDRDVRPFVFGGDCAPTLARMVVEKDFEGRMLAREGPKAIEGTQPGIDYDALFFEPGDGVVTRASLQGRLQQGEALPGVPLAPLRAQHSVFLCEGHRTLTKNPSFQDNLLATLFNDYP
jgi:hypothetical protein